MYSLCVVSLLLLGSVLGQSTTPDDVYRHLTVYTDVLSRIKSEYVEEPDMQGVTLGALNGLLESVDPYASYLDADQYTQYERVRTGEEAGVGLVLSRRVGYVTVVDAIPGSPAGEAGLTTGDMIETIDGVATRDMPLAYAEILLRGSVGSDVVLTVLRVQQGAEPHEVRLRRAKIDYPAVTSQMLPSGIGHVKVRSLESGKSKSVAAEVRKLAASGAERIILDLRRSSTGDPEEGAGTGQPVPRQWATGLPGRPEGDPKGLQRDAGIHDQPVAHGGCSEPWHGARRGDRGGGVA